MIINLLSIYWKHLFGRTIFRILEAERLLYLHPQKIILMQYSVLRLLIVSVASDLIKIPFWRKSFIIIKLKKKRVTRMFIPLFLYSLVTSMRSKLKAPIFHFLLQLHKNLLWPNYKRTHCPCLVSLADVTNLGHKD